MIISYFGMFIIIRSKYKSNVEDRKSCVEVPEESFFLLWDWKR